MCPDKECILEVKNGKVHCITHDRYLKIVDDWENRKYDVKMRHILYVACSNGVDGEVLIDSEQ